MIIIKTKKTTKQKYKYSNNQDVIYLGKLYENYHKKIARIKSRTSKRRVEIWYCIKFEDGFQLDVKENWITSTQIEMEDL
jgi:hypothetical protein